jgi:hypothetical protein
MGVDNAVYIRTRLHDFGMNKNFGVAFIFAVDLFSRLNIDHNNMLRPDLFEAEAVRLHEKPTLTWDAHRNMAENIVPVAFIGENVA